MIVLIKATMRDRGGVQENERWGDVNGLLIVSVVVLFFQDQSGVLQRMDGQIRW